jgi:hypothetical protein
MANPLPGQEAIDNNDGTATTRYDDGSSVTWRIDTGQLVSSTPAGGGAAPTSLTGTAGGTTPGSYYLYPGTPSPSWWNAPTNPLSIGAGTSEQGYGWGVPGFGQAPIQIQPNYLDYLKTAPGYIPGSGTYNQWNLSQPGLVGTVGGVPNMNLRYGQGGTGDPTTGREPQTPEEWVQGGKLFNTTRTSNWGQGDQAGTGLDYIANLFLRSDTPSGIGTPAWSAPDAYWQGLAQQIAAGTIQPTARGWQALAAKGYTPQKIGGAATQQEASVGGAGGAGGPDSALQDYLASIQANAQAMQAAQLAYQDWVMRTGDDQLAFEKANEAWRQKFEEVQFDYKKQQDQWNLQQSAGYFEVNGQRTPTLAGIAQEAGLTGMYKGAPTFAREQYQSGVMQNLLGLQAGLRGPENYAQYLKVLGSTPQGMRDVVNAAAGRFQMPSTSGVTPGQQTRPADVQSLLRDVTSGGAQAQADWTSALSGGLPNPNQLNLRNYSAMSPTQRSMLMSAYEGEGWDPRDVQHMIQQSSPVGAVGGGGGMTGAFRF